ncbi:MAG: lasso peptide isopeptide bond-forming cyclase [bacterium]
MSAILGIYYADGQPVDEGDLERMMAALAHRGADGSGSWHGGQIAFGHQMFFTTPESLHEKLPCYHDATGLAITADARIDNRAELIDILDLKDEAATGLSDSAIILAAYVTWGRECVDHLLGDFAFAIWDASSEQLFCARDHFGVRPLYYSYQHGEFYFATQLRGILALPHLSHQLNDEKIMQYLSLYFNDRENCFYQNMHRLPAASTLTVAADGIHIEKYWSLDSTKEIRFNTSTEYDAAFREIFIEAVRCRLRSAFPLGTALSGGMDSSSITCMARDILKQDEIPCELHTFSAIYNKLAQCDERPYINSVIEQGGITPHLVPMDNISPFRAYVDMQQRQDEPYFGTTMFLHQGLYTSVRSCGGRTMLEGFGGDSVIGHGWHYFIELAQGRHWRTLYRQAYAVAGSGRIAALRMAWHLGVSPIITAYISGNLKGHGIRANFPLRQDLLKQYQINKRIGGSNRNMQRVWTERDAQYKDLSQGFYQGIFEAYDVVSATYGIDARYPFWDKRLVEFCLALPPEMKFHNGLTRYIIRRALQGVLPHEIATRRGKTDIAPHYDVEMTCDTQLLQTTVDSQRGNLTRYVDWRKFESYFQRFIKCNTDRRSTWMYVWPAATLATWLSKHENDTDFHEINCG